VAIFQLALQCAVAIGPDARDDKINTALSRHLAQSRPEGTRVIAAGALDGNPIRPKLSPSNVMLTGVAGADRGGKVQQIDGHCYNPSTTTKKHEKQTSGVG
jgi:hypothetical protein